MLLAARQKTGYEGGIFVDSNPDAIKFEPASASADNPEAYILKNNSNYNINVNGTSLDSESIDIIKPEGLIKVTESSTSDTSFTIQTTQGDESATLSGLDTGASYNLIISEDNLETENVVEINNLIPGNDSDISVEIDGNNILIDNQNLSLNVDLILSKTSSAAPLS